MTQEKGARRQEASRWPKKAQGSLQRFSSAAHSLTP